MKKIIVPFVLLITHFCLSQVGFKKITIIKSNQEKIECYSTNFDVSEEADFIKYYINKRDQPKTIDIDSIDYVIRGKKKYIIAKEIEFDNTSNDYNKISHMGEKSYNKFFFLSKHNLYLEVLVNGQATLYKSYLNKVTKFFYKVNDDIKPLMYKVYFRVRHHDYIGPDFALENNFYIQQLRNEISCQKVSNNIELPKYQKFQLISYFKKINESNCLGTHQKSFKKENVPIRKD